MSKSSKIKLPRGNYRARWGMFHETAKYNRRDFEMEDDFEEIEPKICCEGCGDMLHVEDISPDHDDYCYSCAEILEEGE